MPGPPGRRRLPSSEPGSHAGHRPRRARPWGRCQPGAPGWKISPSCFMVIYIFSEMHQNHVTSWKFVKSGRRQKRAPDANRRALTLIHVRRQFKHHYRRLPFTVLSLKFTRRNSKMEPMHCSIRKQRLGLPASENFDAPSEICPF